MKLKRDRFEKLKDKKLPDVRVEEHVPCELKNTHARNKAHSCH